MRKETVYKLEITCFRKWVAGGHLRSLKINNVYLFTVLLLAYLLRKPEFSRQRFFELLYTTYVILNNVPGTLFFHILYIAR